MSTPRQPEEELAPLDERVNVALEVVDELVEMLPLLLKRLQGVEGVLQQGLPIIDQRVTALESRLPTAADGEQRSDYRVELYPPAEDERELTAQITRVRLSWQRLTQWVDWLVATYRLTTVIPACWPEHVTIVEELVGLRVAWVSAWSDTASTDAVVVWHERLSRARSRLTDGNWGNPRCHQVHDATDVALAEQNAAWTESPVKSRALIAARDRAAATAREQRSQGGARP